MVRYNIQAPSPQKARVDGGWAVKRQRDAEAAAAAEGSDE